MGSSRLVSAARERATESEPTKMPFDQYGSRIPRTSSRRDATAVWYLIFFGGGCCFLLLSHASWGGSHMATIASWCAVAHIAACCVLLRFVALVVSIASLQQLSVYDVAEAAAAAAPSSLAAASLDYCRRTGAAPPPARQPKPASSRGSASGPWSRGPGRAGPRCRGPCIHREALISTSRRHRRSRDRRH